MALSAAPSLPFSPPGSDCRGRLQLQAAKVISAQVASVGDYALGAILSAAAGLYVDAAHALQDHGFWLYAATLAAHSLSAADRAHVLKRWAAQQVLGVEGAFWRALGVLSSVGCFRAALAVLQRRRAFVDTAAFLQACDDASCSLAEPNSNVASDADDKHAAAADDISSGGTCSDAMQSAQNLSVAASFAEDQFVCSLLEHVFGVGRLK